MHIAGTVRMGSGHTIREPCYHAHPMLTLDNCAVPAKILRVCKDQADRRISETIHYRRETQINDNATSWQRLP